MSLSRVQHISVSLDGFATREGQSSYAPFITLASGRANGRSRPDGSPDVRSARQLGVAFLHYRW
jgi:hypothetical protein